MDFHSLSRRELQALCKMNKIPANITNIAMADALQALETFEGLEEMLIQSEAGYLETPAKSMTAARSVSRTSTKQRVLKEEPENSKLTTRGRRGTRKAEAETDAAPPKFAQSTQRNVESAYTTRRSTRLLEKQMCQLSLNDNADMVDTNSDKDSQDLQRQFSQDMDNSLAPDTKTVSDESNVTEEAAKETNVLEDMDLLPENEKSFPVVESVNKNDPEDACNEVVELKIDEDQPMQEDVEESCNEVVVESSTNEKSTLSSDQPMQEDVAVQMDTVSHYESSSVDESEVQDNLNGIDDTEEATQLELTTVDVMEETLGSESDSNADDGSSTDDASAVDSDDVKQVDPQIKLEHSSALIADKGDEIEAEQKMDTFKMKAPEVSEDEFGFLSESDGEEVDQLVEEDVQNKNENPLLVDGIIPESVFAGVENAIPSDDMISESAEEATEEMASKSPFQARSPLMARDQMEGTLESSSKKSASVCPVPITDNKENLQTMSASTKPLLALPAVTAPRAARTPIDKKSLRQLKKMVKGLYKQAEETQPAPLQVHAENV